MSIRTRLLGALIVVPAVVLAGCSSSGGGTTGTPAPTGGPATGATSTGTASGAPTSAGPQPTFTTKVGVKVSPNFGSDATMIIPDSAAPAQLTAQVLTKGKGAAVAKGDTLIANYAGETWAKKDGKANVFDSSFSRGQPAGFVIGTGAVIPGWDKTLVGKPLGSRVLITIPPADGYPDGQPSANIDKDDTLVFVIDLVAAYKPDASAPGVAVKDLPKTGWPEVSGKPGAEPKITSTAGVTAPTETKSLLLVKGTGAKIDNSKSLVLQLVEADLATGKSAQSTWGQGPQVATASEVDGRVDALAGQRVGSRAEVLLPATAAVPGSATQASQPAQPAAVLIIDVVGQF